ncbi:methylosome subunit pICln-like [Artemia franciscana]|uniref:Methylosome subunit pICln n=1 Tax=Artemia franciscana TaxID=6661 RepID=A0AA88I193_ARTSF|nr:hypothetical protein QYM36_002530 [Artemia franciscana]
MPVLGSVHTPQEEGIKVKDGHTELVINETNYGAGTLIISEQAVFWIQNATNQGLTLNYANISLHGISRDPSSYPKPCLYLMIDEAHEIERSEDGDNEEYPPINEVRFVPSQPDRLEEMYKALSDCQLLHPDPDNSVSDFSCSEDDEGDQGEVDNVGGLAQNGQGERGEEDQFMDAD